jgi:hypothetical protein
MDLELPSQTAASVTAIPRGPDELPAQVAPRLGFDPAKIQKAMPIPLPHRVFVVQQVSMREVQLDHQTCLAVQFAVLLRIAA